MPPTLLVAGGRTFTGATTTQTFTDIQNVGSRGIVVVVDVTAIGTGNITLTINGKDPQSGKYYLLLAGAAIAGNTTTRYTVYPTGIAAVANVTAVDVIPEVVQLVVTANNANPVTYTVGFTLIP